MKSINQNNEIIGTYEIEENDEERGFYYMRFYERNKKQIKIKDEMNIRFLSKYSEDLFFAKDINDNIKIYKFKDKSFELYQNFPSIITACGRRPLNGILEPSNKEEEEEEKEEDNNSKFQPNPTKEIKGMIQLKNNYLIMYSDYNIFVIKNY